MVKELGYGKALVGKTVRFYRVKKNNHRIQVIRVTENMYKKLKKMSGYIQMDYAVKSYFNTYRISQQASLRERVKKLNKSQPESEKRVGIWEKIKQWFKKNIIRPLTVDKIALKKLKGR